MLVQERHAEDAELAALLEAAFAELARRYGAEGRSAVGEGARFLVAYVDGRAAGCGALQPTGEADLVELKRMFVIPEQRGRGVASAVLTALEGLAVELGHRGIRLATGVRQPEAIALYEKHGYLATEPWGKYAGDPLTRCYRKALLAAGA